MIVGCPGTTASSEAPPAGQWHPHYWGAEINSRTPSGVQARRARRRGQVPTHAFHVPFRLRRRTFPHSPRAFPQSRLDAGEAAASRVCPPSRPTAGVLPHHDRGEAADGPRPPCHQVVSSRLRRRHRHTASAVADRAGGGGEPVSGQSYRQTNDRRAGWKWGPPPYDPIRQRDWHRANARRGPGPRLIPKQ